MGGLSISPRGAGCVLRHVPLQLLHRRGQSILCGSARLRTCGRAAPARRERPGLDGQPDESSRVVGAGRPVSSVVTWAGVLDQLPQDRAKPIGGCPVVVAVLRVVDHHARDISLKSNSRLAVCNRRECEQSRPDRWRVPNVPSKQNLPAPLSGQPPWHGRTNQGGRS